MIALAVGICVVGVVRRCAGDPLGNVAVSEHPGQRRRFVALHAVHGAQGSRNQSCVDTARAAAHRVSVHAHDARRVAARPGADQRMLIVGLGGGTLPTALAELFPNATHRRRRNRSRGRARRKALLRFRADRHMHVFEQDARVWVKRAVSGSESLRPDHARRVQRRLHSRTSDDARVSGGDARAAHRRRRSCVEYVRDQPISITTNRSLMRTCSARSSTCRSPDSSNRIIIARRGPLPDTSSTRRTAHRSQRA